MPSQIAQSDETSSTDTLFSRDSLFDAKKIRIKNWLASKSPVLASLYEGAVTILYAEPPVSGWPQFVSHAVREIANRLPDHLAGPEVSTRSGFNLNNEIRKIAQIWRNQTLEFIDTSTPTETTSSVPSSESIPIPKDIYLSLSNIVKDDSESEGRKYKKAKRLFETLIPEGEFRENEPIIDQWIGITGWFADGGRVHVNYSKDTIGDRSEYKNNFEMVEHILLGLIDSSEDFSQLPKELNEILENANN